MAAYRRLVGTVSLGALVPLLLILALTAGCSSKQAESEEDSAPAKPVDVSVVRAKAGSLPTVVDGFGSLVVPPNHVASVSSVSGGRVVGLHARVGDHVRSGQLLVELQPDPAVQSDLAKARIAYQAAKRERDRQKALVAAGVAAGMKLEDAQSAFDQAAADLSLKEAAYQLSERNTALRAPIAGVVTEASVSVGMVLAPQSTAVTVSDLSGLWADVAVPADSLARIHPGMPADVALDGGAMLKGRVATVDRTLSPDTQRGSVRIALAAHAADPGAFVRAHLIVGSQQGVLVPSAAVLAQEDARTVYTVEGGKAYAQKVTVAQEAGGMALITRGLSPDAVVATTGAYELSDGAAVHPVGDAR